MSPSPMDRGYRLTRYAAGLIAVRVGEPSESADPWKDATDQPPQR